MHQNSTSPCGSGFTNAQLALLGVVEKKRGWLTELIGKDIPTEVAEEFERLGYAGRTREKYMPKMPHEKLGISIEAYKSAQEDALNDAWNRIHERAMGWMTNILSIDQIRESIFAGRK